MSLLFLSSPSSLSLLRSHAPLPLSPRRRSSHVSPRLSLSPPSLPLFLSWFRGDFDNFHQADIDRQNASLKPHECHEHTHCRLLPLSIPDLSPRNQPLVYAVYYYNGNPEIVYRRRIYEFEARTERIHMRIYKMQYIHGLRVAGRNSRFEGFDMGSLGDGALYEELKGAEVGWRWEDGEKRFVGELEKGVYEGEGGWKYEDTLVLGKEELWVGEKVYDENGRMVGGNRDGVPHRMRRVRREDEELKWTLDWELPEVRIGAV